MKKLYILLLLTGQLTGSFAQKSLLDKVRLVTAPENYQLYPRDQNDSAALILAGNVEGKNQKSSLIFKVFKDDELYDSKKGELDNGSFHIESKINAGLFQYSIQLYLEKKGKKTLCYSADSVVCGDAFIITGQSNSHPSSSQATYSSLYCRSFGVKTGYDPYTEEDKKVRWGRATGSCPDLKGVGGWFTKNPFGVGVWGMELMKLIVEKYKVPVCIINGGSGSSSIEENMLYPEVPSLETSFGRLAYRVNQAGLKDRLKAIFWHQGETNSNASYKTYEANFDMLLNDWKRVYAGLEKIYLFQLHPGCGGDFQSEMREIQSQLAMKYDMIEIMSTTEVVGHDGCHFSYEGYNEFAHRIFPLVSRDFYREQIDYPITPPKLLSTYYKNEDEIVLEFDQLVEVEEKHEIGGTTYQMKDQFFLRMDQNDVPEYGAVEKIEVNEKQLILKVKKGLQYKYISWLPNVNYKDTEICYQGPWIRGAQNNYGALSFDRKSIIPEEDFGEYAVTDWYGYQMIDSTLNAIPFKVVFPKKPNNNRDWIWRARFWGHEPQTDLALLEQGFHLAYIEVGGLFGNERAIQTWNDFYSFMIHKYNLSEQVVLEGMSRGGLIIYNWGNRNAEKVACIYGDAPVCDFKSWPGGKGNGKGSPQDWEICLSQYGFSEEIALNYNGNPIDHMENLAGMKVPILNVVGDADRVVPVEENTAILERRLEELGWRMEVIHKPGIGHHPHSLKDPKRIVDFILKHTGKLE